MDRLRDQRGFSMVVVMLVMMASGLFVVGAFAAADGDLPIARGSQDRKTAYAAAEAGLNYYLYHVTQDNDYWTKCTNVSAPNPTEPSPLNQRWSGVGSDPRQWRNLPSSQAQYTIELLPAAPFTQCVEGNEVSMVDPSTGTFRIRSTGRSRNIKRSIIGTFRRTSFLDFLYFTDYETRDPSAYPDAVSRSWAASNCVDYRAGRHSSCTEIQFASGDRIQGPFHTNDNILVCTGASFGRTPADSIEVSGPTPGYIKVCGGEPNFIGTFRAERPTVNMPPTNSGLRTVATSAYRYTGRTSIRLKGAVMDVTLSTGVTQTDVPLPSNGVIYVSSDVGGCPATSPVLADYAEGTGCGNLYVSGTYSQSLTLAAENDIIVSAPDGSSDANVLRSGNVVLGLIANNFVRVAHRVIRTNPTSPNSCTNEDSPTHPFAQDVEIDAAILSLNHSFIVDNYGCGADLGTLTVDGAIAQRFRGPVGTTGGTGFIKDYQYDDRLRYRSPPYFLEPLSAAWRVVRVNEQAPPT